ncbi:MAG: ribosomal protein S18-alanine N-acetyltransferase [bacterium]
MTKNGTKDTICGKLKIDKMQLSDLPEIMCIETLCFKAPWKLNYFETELDYSDSTSLTVRLDNKIIGYIVLRTFVDEVHIMNIAVAPDYRTKGIATKILKYVFENISKDMSMLLEVRQSNIAAQNLYKKMGFTCLYTRKAYYDDGENAIVMVKGYDNITKEGKK